MSTTTTPTIDVHVGDVGTQFKGELTDRGVAFNPAGYDTLTLVFKTPTGIVIAREATVTTEGAGASQKWFANYETVAADIEAGLHAVRGTYYWQGEVTFPSGAKYSTDIQTYLVDSNLR